jgi:hypothetical protein
MLGASRQLIRSRLLGGSKHSATPAGAPGQRGWGWGPSAFQRAARAHGPLPAPLLVSEAPR